MPLHVDSKLVPYWPIWYQRVVKPELTITPNPLPITTHLFFTNTIDELFPNVAMPTARNLLSRFAQRNMSEEEEQERTTYINGDKVWTRMVYNLLPSILRYCKCSKPTKALGSMLSIWQLLSSRFDRDVRSMKASFSIFWIEFLLKTSLLSNGKSLNVLKKKFFFLINEIIAFPSDIFLKVMLFDWVRNLITTACASSWQEKN